MEQRIPAPGGGTLWVERQGSGTPVVLLHGAGMDSRLWTAVVPALAGHHTVVRYDARGLGRSSPPEQPYWDVDDLAAVLDRVGVDRVALVGLSMGGETALDFALIHPDRVTSLALIGSGLSGHTWPETPDLAAYTAARRAGDAVRLAELELAIWAPLGTGAPGAAAGDAPGGALVAAMVADNAHRRIASESLARYRIADARARLGEVAAPTLVVHGDRDHPAIAAIAAVLAANIAGARAETVPGADHYLPLRAPRRLVELLLRHG
jgi:pimeloyl-ACP methyl ester carboxylesterase